MSQERIVSVNLKVWRQKGPSDAGRFEEFPNVRVSTEASFLEMLDTVNEQIVNSGGEPIAFEFGWTAKGVYHCFKVGYDPATAQFSPGQLLRMLLVERLRDQRARAWARPRHDRVSAPHAPFP